MPRLPNQLTGLTLGLGAILFWGFSFVGTKLALSEISPIAVVVGRTAVGAAFLLVLMLAQRRALRVPRSCWGAVALAGFLGVFVHNGVQAHALTVTTAVRTGWLVAVVPLWSAILARLFLGEGLSWVRCAGLGVGFGGAALLITGDSSLGSRLCRQPEEICSSWPPPSTGPCTRSRDVTSWGVWVPCPQRRRCSWRVF